VTGSNDLRRLSRKKLTATVSLGALIAPSCGFKMRNVLETEPEARGRKKIKFVEAETKTMTSTAYAAAG